MKNFLKCSICLFLVIVILISSTTISAFAITETASKKIISALQLAENIKNELGLSEVDFGELTISSPIYSYEYTQKGFVQNNVMYALKHKNELVAWAISLDRNGELEFQITTALIKEVNAVLSANTCFALIYDSIYCYLYNGNSFIPLYEYSLEINNRCPLPKDIGKCSTNRITLTSISESENLNYSYISSRVQTYYSCSVGYVTQDPPSHLCWAASIACIVNSKKGTNYNAKNVAQTYYGTDNYNIGLTVGLEQDILRKKYYLWYTYKNSVPSDAIIGRNIQNNYPLYASFAVSNGGRHAVVIYGVDIVKGYIAIMDPEFGFIGATISTNGYQYISAYSGYTLTWDMATCRYWSS